MKLFRYQVVAKDVNGDQVMVWSHHIFRRLAENQVKRMTPDIWTPIPNRPLYTLEVKKI